MDERKMTEAPPRKPNKFEETMTRTFQLKGWMILGLILGSYILGFYFGRGG